jgi:hypothetical protein
MAAVAAPEAEARPRLPPQVIFFAAIFGVILLGFCLVPF